VTGHNLVVDGGFVASGGQGQTTAADKAALAPLLEKYSTSDDKWGTIGTAKA
jgi:hypothetical protein